MVGDSNIYAADAQAMRYSTAAVVIHWLTAALLLTQVYVGFTFHEMPRGPDRGEWFMWHKTLGATILLLALVRLAVRLMRRPPPFPADYPRWQAAAATWIHRLLYVLLILLPVTGLMAVSDGAENGLVPIKGGLAIPAVPGVSEDLGEGAGEVHEILVWTTIVMLVGHILAALWHQFVDRGPTAGRMWPFRSTTSV